MFFVTATLLASCTINNVPDAKVVTLSIGSNQWTPHTDIDGYNLFYSRTISMPEITQNIYTYGSVLTYYVMYNDFDVQVAQQVLPYVRHYENSDGARWTRTVDFEYSPGSITIIVTNSDFLNEIPPLMDFRVVMQE